MGHAGLARAGVRRLAPRRGLAQRAVERLLHRPRRLRLAAGQPGEELVRAGAHRAEDQVGFRRPRRSRRSPSPRGRLAAARSPPSPTRRRRADRRRRRRGSIRRRCPRPSTMPTGTPHARIICAACRLNSSSWLTISAVSCAMVLVVRSDRWSGSKADALRWTSHPARVTEWQRAVPPPRPSVSGK